MPRLWHDCATAMARWCHRYGTGVPPLWHGCAIRMAQVIITPFND